MGQQTEQQWYDTSDADLVESWERTHRNDDQTHVALLEFGEFYQAIATDVNPDGEVLAVDVVARALTETEAYELTRRWLDEHDRGLEPDEGGLSGFFG